MMQAMMQRIRSLPAALWGLVLFAELVVCAPLIIGNYTAPVGQVPSRFGYLTQDNAVYENYITQAKEGHLTFKDRFTSEQQPRGIFNIFWLAVGNLARVLNLEPWQAMLLSRIILAPLVILTVYYVTGFVIPSSDVRMRAKVAWYMVFANGIGFLLTRLVEPGPADTFAPEAMVNTILTTSPHMMASFILLVLCYLQFFRWTQTWQTMELIMSGLAGIILLQFHPYFAPIIPINTVCWMLMQRSEWSAKRWVQYGMYLGALSIPVMYVLYTLTDAFTQIRYATNVTPSPPLWSTVIAFSILWGLAYRGLSTHKTLPFIKFAAIWIVVAFVMMYMPTPVNRRFLQGAIVPLGLLAFLGLRHIAGQHKIRALMLTFLTTIGGAINILIIAQIIASATVPKDLDAMVKRMATLKPGVVLGIPDDVAFIVARTPHTAYVAHWSETIHLVEKSQLAKAIVDFPIHPRLAYAMSLLPPLTIQPDTLQKAGITYVLTHESCPSATQQILKQNDLTVCEVVPAE